MSLAQSCSWKPHAVIRMLDASSKNVDCELTVPGTFAFYISLNYKAPFSLTVVFSEADTREQETKSYTKSQCNFNEHSLRIFSLTSLGFSWLNPKSY